MSRFLYLRRQVERYSIVQRVRSWGFQSQNLFAVLSAKAGNPWPHPPLIAGTETSNGTSMMERSCATPGGFSTSREPDEMGTSDRGGEGLAPAIIQHPDTQVPAELLHAAYVELVSAIARHEPDALQRAAWTIDEAVSLPGETPGGAAQLLARAWLGFTGHHDRIVSAPPARTFSFAFPATMTFDTVGTGTQKAAHRRALQALRAVMDQDVPLAALSGPLPGYPSILDVVVWVGSTERYGGEDKLRLELATEDEDAEG